MRSLSRKQQCFIGVGVLFLLLIVAGILGGGEADPSAPSPTATQALSPTATAIPGPTQTPRPTSTPRPTQTPTAAPAPLETTTSANLWIQIVRDEVLSGIEFWDVLADPAFDVDEFDLNVYIDGREYCNPNPLYGDQGFGELSCESYEPRTQEPEVYATVGNSLFGTVERLVCAQNVATRSRYNMIYACYWR